MTTKAKPIRVLVVDDSAFMRKAITNMLVSSPDFQVVDTARNGLEALKKVEALNPDVMTLDIEMPGLDGLTVLERVMESHPLPVLIVSSKTEAGASVTVRALELGAIDFIPKHLNGSSLNIGTIRDQLHEKVRVAAYAKGKVGKPFCDSRVHIHTGVVGSPPSEPKDLIRKFTRSPGYAQRLGPRSTESHIPAVVAIGSSTGGPQALQAILMGLPENFPGAVVVAQHMPQFFTKPFSERLNLSCGLTVREARDGDEVQVGVVLVAPGGQHLTFQVFSSGAVQVKVSHEPAELLYRPSVDLLLGSAANIFGRKVLGVILTGMGQDGLEGARAIRANGGRVLAQDEASCIVYGMPKAVAEEGCADQIVSLPQMAAEIESQVRGLVAASLEDQGEALSGVNVV